MRHLSNRNLTIFLGTVVVVIGVTTLMTVGGSDPVEDRGGFSLPCEIQPSWSVPPEPYPVSAAAEPDGAELLVVLDTSHSMGGFLPPSEQESSGFRAAAQLVPGHLVKEFGGRIGWETIAEEPRTLSKAPRFERSEFLGSSTRLEVALERILQRLESGRTAAAVLVTDLVANGGPEGAMGAAEPLAHWVRSARVAQGEFDVGILGARSRYWGVTSSTCPPRADGLGCWYSEYENHYKRLEQVVERPLFFLVFGRAGNGAGRRQAGEMGSVEAVGNALLATLDELDLEPRWELLTPASRNVPGRLDCSLRRPDGREQFALYRRPDGGFECRRDEPVVIACSASTGTVGTGAASVVEVDTAPESGVSIPLLSGSLTWPSELASAHFANGDLEVEIDCARLRDEKPSRDLLLRDVTGRWRGPETELWEDWTARSDELEEHLSGTIQLSLFMETVRLRPDRLSLEPRQPLLQVAGGGR